MQKEVLALSLLGIVSICRGPLRHGKGNNYQRQLLACTWLYHLVSKKAALTKHCWGGPVLQPGVCTNNRAAEACGQALL